jgi:hypothetical protein
VALDSLSIPVYNITDVPFGLADAYLFEARLSGRKGSRPFRAQAPVDFQAEVFSSRHSGAKRFDLFVQIAITERRKEFPLRKGVESSQIDNTAGYGLNLPAYSQFDLVVMAMPVGVIAFPEGFRVLRV